MEREREGERDGEAFTDIVLGQINGILSEATVRGQGLGHLKRNVDLQVIFVIPKLFVIKFHTRQPTKDRNHHHDDDDELEMSIHGPLDYGEQEKKLSANSPKNNNPSMLTSISLSPSLPLSLSLSANELLEKHESTKAPIAHDSHSRQCQFHGIAHVIRYNPSLSSLLSPLSSLSLRS